MRQEDVYMLDELRQIIEEGEVSGVVQSVDEMLTNAVALNICCNGFF